MLIKTLTELSNEILDLVQNLNWTILSEMYFEELQSIYSLKLGKSEQRIFYS